MRASERPFWAFCPYTGATKATQTMNSDDAGNVFIRFHPFDVTRTLVSFTLGMHTYPRAFMAAVIVAVETIAAAG
jgi:hypothetical protein